MIHSYSRFFVSSFSLFFFAFASLTVTYAASSPRSRGVQTIRVLLKEDSSLNSIIQKAGYSLADRDVAAFLAEFTRLNEGLRSISSIRQGTEVKLPLSFLVKLSETQSGTRKKRRVPQPKRGGAGIPGFSGLPRTRPEPAVSPDQSSERRSQTVRAIRSLVEQLSGRAVMEPGGLKYFAVGQRTEISFDTTSFPMMALSNGAVLVLDPSGALPDEVREIIRLVWPEYVFVSYREGQDLRTVIDRLLVSLGYVVRRDRTLIAGGDSSIQYRADFVIFRKEDDLLEGEIMVVTVIGPHERAVPESLVRWFGSRDIRLIQLDEAGPLPAASGRAEVMDAGGSADSSRLVEKIVSALGYTFKRDAVLSLSDRKDFTYKLRADISIAAGARAKVIEFAELSAQEIAYARKRGVDVVCVDFRDDDRAVLRKLVDLLGLPHTDSPDASAPVITPRNTRYRLILPGVYLKTRQGAFFITDTGLDAALLRDVVDPAITVITY